MVNASDKIDPQKLYVILGHHIGETPDFSGYGPLTAEQNAWLGKACALVKAGGDMADTIQINVAAQHMTGPLRVDNAQAIAVILNRTLAVAELQAPASAQGAFIAAGSAFSAMAAIGKVLMTAVSDILIVDPYMSDVTLCDYAVLAPEKVPLRLLADKSSHKPSLKPAATAWITQYGTVTPS